MSLKFQETAAIGDSIKAFDFEPMAGRSDRYIEGTVKIVDMNHGYGYAAFIIECTYDSTTCNRVGKEMAIPLETSDDFDTRVTKVN